MLGVKYIILQCNVMDAIFTLHLQLNVQHERSPHLPVHTCACAHFDRGRSSFFKGSYDTKKSSEADMQQGFFFFFFFFFKSSLKLLAFLRYISRPTGIFTQSCLIRPNKTSENRVKLLKRGILCHLFVNGSLLNILTMEILKYWIVLFV